LRDTAECYQTYQVHLYQLSHIIDDIKGIFSAGTYRAKYKNYLARIQKRVDDGKLDLNELLEKVKIEVKRRDCNDRDKDKQDTVFDEDEMPDW